ncbi:MAG: hypothetical protein R3305_04875, partial [Gammaproteobacteria bacterium]|nr:hypothetical protein [Gammaproteobacteria bacterium]
MSLNSSDTGATAEPAVASLWRRLASVAYDALLVLALMFALTIGVLVLRAGTAITPESLSFQLLLLGSWWLYFAGSWVRG